MRQEDDIRQPADLAAHPESPEAGQSRQTRILLEILDWAKYILGAILLGFLLTNYVVQRNEVVGKSMFPTLQDEDQLWVEKISPRLDNLSHGDIITFKLHDDRLETEDEDLVKRIIAVPGDRLQITENGVLLNGMIVDEDYLLDGMVTEPSGEPSYNDITLGPDEYFVMGDNRINSRDSRTFGPVKKKDIIGEVWIRIFPFDRFGKP